MENGEKKESGGSFLKGILFGGLVGAVVALLYAPKSGKALREDIKKKSGELKKDADILFEEAKNRATELIEKGIKQAEVLKNEAEQKLEEAKIKAAEIIEESKKLAGEIKHKAGETLVDARDLVAEGKKTVKDKKSKIKQAMDAGKEKFQEEMGKIKSRRA